MTMPIGKILKGLSLAVILLAVPAFAVFGLIANASYRSSSVEIAAEYDPLRNGFITADRKATRGEQPIEAVAYYANELVNWIFTCKPVPSPTEPPPTVCTN